MKDSALVVVDMLYDFIDGSLACEGADEAITNTLSFLEKQEGFFPVLFVRDHHPADHSSFKEQGGIWPPHCVQGTHGAEIHEALAPYADEGLCFYKGEDRDKEQYSGFEGVNHAGQALGDVLSMMEIRNVLVCGIATEYCVLNTAEDLKKAGFKVHVLKDCLAYVDYDGHVETLRKMEQEGIRLI